MFPQESQIVFDIEHAAKKTLVNFL